MKTLPRKNRSCRMITIATNHDFHEWVDRLANHVGRDKSTTIEEALRDLARRTQFPEKPPRRV